MHTATREIQSGLVALGVLVLAALSAPGDGVLGNTATAQDAQWIWSPAQERDVAAGACYFRKTIQTDRPEHAEVQITADDSYELFVNGRSAGEGKNWRVMQTHDITKLLTAGRNTIAVKVINAEPPSAGLAARVLVKASGGTFVAYPTDATWKCSLREPANWMKPTLNDSQWLAARVIGPLGQAKPWLDEVLMADGGGASRFKTSREFRVETAVPPEQTGSLLTIAFNEFGEIVASVENGGLVLIRDANGDGALDKPIELTDKVKNCQGILPLNGQLYVVGSGSDSEGFGLFRLTDTDNDGKPDESKRLIKFTGESHEHGPHAAVLGPDGFIYVIIGNHTKAEAEPAATSPYRNPIEGDLIAPRYEDPRGHAAGIKAPGGVVLRTDTEGSFVETFAGGLRNAYDIAFNRRGDLFTYDSDMEWDSGLPWYRPTRVNLLTPGAECGWRSGWAVWPDYFYDSLPAVINTGRGSPTGVASYQHVMYPRRYHDALFVGDWAGGRILALRMRPQGGGYTAEVETFVEGRPLNVTDLAVGPDGALYFCTGGRGTSGGIYRVVWNGRVPPAMTDLGRGLEVALRQPQLDSAWGRQRCAIVQQQLGEAWDRELPAITEKATVPVEQRLRALDLMQLLGPFPETSLLVRLSRDPNELIRAKAATLMGIHSDELSGAALVALLADPDPGVQRAACDALARGDTHPPLEKLLPLISSSERFVAFAATRVLERLPAAEGQNWHESVLASNNSRVFLQGSLARLAAGADRDAIDQILRRNLQLMQGFLSDADFLDMLRLTQLCLIRGQIKPDEVPALRLRLADEFPTKAAALNRELVRLIAYLKEPGANDRLLDQLTAEIPQEDKMHVALHAPFIGGWTTNQKLDLLAFLERARMLDGGHSFVGYIENISRDFFADLSESERMLVLGEGVKWPSSALSVLARLPTDVDRATLDQVRRLDQRLVGLDQTESIHKLGIGVIAVLGRSGDADSLRYLREVYERDPARRGYIAMALAQSPDENWHLLVQSLPIVDGIFAQEVLQKLATVEQVPDKPEAVRQVILRGLKLGDTGGQHAIALLEKWTAQKLSEPTDKPSAALAAWQKWFSQTYPHEPEAALPIDSADNRWTQDELFSYLTSTEALGASPARGSEVFTKAQCAACHRFGDYGESIGPDLTTIGQRFQKKEILESIVHPSQVISDQYASRTVVMRDGRSVTGIVAPQGDGSLIVLQANSQKARVPKDQIEDVTPSRQSAMPDGLLNTLTLEEIADLFAYLTQPPRASVTSRRSPNPR
jgi:putative heme-binding domain-containing protein